MYIINIGTWLHSIKMSKNKIPSEFTFFSHKISTVFNISRFIRRPWADPSNLVAGAAHPYTFRTSLPVLTRYSTHTAIYLATRAFKLSSCSSPLYQQSKCLFTTI